MRHGIIIKKIGAHALEIHNIANAPIRIDQRKMIVGPPFETSCPEAGHRIALWKNGKLLVKPVLSLERIPLLVSHVHNQVVVQEQAGEIEGTRDERLVGFQRLHRPVIGKYQRLRQPGINMLPRGLYLVTKRKIGREIPERNNAFYRILVITRYTITFLYT